MLVTIAIRDLGTISKKFNQWLVIKSSDNLNFGILQKAYLLGMARIFRHVLDI